jgi:pyruvate,water dikinase
MSNTRNFNQISKEDGISAGGKGASLGEMTRAGILVPPGFVIFADTFRKFIRDNGLEEQIANSMKQAQPETVDRISHEIRLKIEKAAISQDVEEEILDAFDKLRTDFVAVRSSATAEDSSTASWAGELETYLNTTKENLIEKIRMCWSSLFTSRAIFYRIRHQMQEDDVAVAVVVQKMIDSEVAGICFTTHPVTKDANMMVIEAGWGLGETVVGGQVTPDTYIVEKESLGIKETYPSEQEIMLIRSERASKEVDVPAHLKGKQKLSNDTILELSKICKKIEDHYGFPCDIEWALADNVFHILQARPITTL